MSGLGTGSFPTSLSGLGTGLNRTELSQTDLSLKVPNGTFVTGTKVPK